MGATPRPLAGLRVLDASVFLAGPLACSLLADWGADVVKVEPLSGDPARWMGGPQLTRGITPTFAGGNRGKRALAVDYGSSEGRALVARLAAGCDAVIHNQREDVARRLGIDHASLAQEGSGAVVCTISAFGPQGTYAGRAAIDPMVQAMTGMASLTGPPGGEPMRAGPPVVDVCAGVTAAAATLAALLGRERSGQADPVMVSLFDVGLLCNAGFVALRSAEGRTPPRLGNRSHPLLADQFATADGFVVIAVWDERRWTALCTVLGLEALAADPALASNDARLERYDELRPRLEAAIAPLSAVALREALHEAGVPCAVTADLDAVAADPHVRTSGALYDEPRLGGDPVQMAAGPVQLAGHRTMAELPPPRLGEHTRTVLADWLGASPAGVDALVRSGTVAEAGTPASPVAR